MLWENDTRIYYPKGDYDAANPTPPACYSDNGKTASLGAMQPQGEPPHLCVTCPRAVWDQPTPRGNLVPACDSRYKIACLVGGAPSGKVFLLSVPPASRKAYEGYRRFLKQHHAQPYKVVTNLGYVDKAFTFRVRRVDNVAGRRDCHAARRHRRTGDGRQRVRQAAADGAPPARAADRAARPLRFTPPLRRSQPPIPSRGRGADSPPPRPPSERWTAGPCLCCGESHAATAAFQYVLDAEG